MKFLVLTLIAFVGCSSRPESVSLPKEGTLNVSHGDEVKSVDPGYAYDEYSWNVIAAIYEPLYTYDFESPTYRVVPLTAAGLPAVSTDGKTMTIKIRSGIFFTVKDVKARRPLTSHDYVVAISRLADPRVRSPGFWLIEAIVGVSEFQKEMAMATSDSAKNEILLKGISGLVTPDDQTLEIHLTQAKPTFLYALTLPFTAAIAHEFLGPKGELLAESPGTGPFTLREWSRGSRIVLEKNPNYWKPGVPRIDRVAIYNIKETQPAWLRFLSGEFGWFGIPKESYDNVLSQDGKLKPEFSKYRLLIDEGATFWFLGINMRDALLGKNKKLRQAISSALDRDRYNTLFTNGRNKKMLSIVPPGTLGRPKAPRIRFDFDLERAKKLLAEAGFPDGKGLPPLTFDTRGGATEERQLGEFVTEQLGKIGIKILVITNTFPGFLEKQKNSKLQLSWDGWILDYPDAENVFQLLYGPNKAPGSNASSFDHPEFNSLYEKMNSLLPTDSRRTALIAKMEAVVQEEVPWAYMSDQRDMVLVQPWVDGYRPRRMIPSKYRFVGLKR